MPTLHPCDFQQIWNALLATPEIFSKHKSSAVIVAVEMQQGYLQPIGERQTWTTMAMLFQLTQIPSFLQDATSFQFDLNT